MDKYTNISQYITSPAGSSARSMLYMTSTDEFRTSEGYTLESEHFRTDNETDPDYSNITQVPEMCRAVETNLAAPIIMGMCGALGNLLALCVLCKTRTEMRKSFFYTLVTGLAITDLVGQLCTAPIAVTAYATGLTFLSNTPSVCKLHGFLMVGFGLVTPLIVCLMALERVGALCCTYFCSRFLTKQRIRSALAACWIFAIGFAAFPFLEFGQYDLQYPCSWCFLKFHLNPDDQFYVRNAVYSCTYAIINLLVIAVTLVSNVLVAIVLLQARKRRRFLTNGMICQSSDRRKSLGHAKVQRKESAQRDHNLEIQMVCLLFGMTIVFTVCWTPFMYNILRVVVSGKSQDTAGDLLAVRFAAFNQILDPWVYILLRRSLFFRFRSMIRSLFELSKGKGCTCRSSTTGRASVGLCPTHCRRGDIEERLAALEERSPGLDVNVLHAEQAMVYSPTLNTPATTGNQARRSRTRIGGGDSSNNIDERQGLMNEIRGEQRSTRDGHQTEDDVRCRLLHPDSFSVIEGLSNRVKRNCEEPTNLDLMEKVGFGKKMAKNQDDSAVNKPYAEPLNHVRPKDLPDIGGKSSVEETHNKATKQSGNEISSPMSPDIVDTPDTVVDIIAEAHENGVIPNFDFINNERNAHITPTKPNMN